MDFGCYYDPAQNQIRGGFWDADPQETAPVPGDYCGMGADVWYTGHHYGAFNTEPRIASYLGIAEGQIPAKHYFGTYRTFPDSCDWDWTETRPTGRVGRVPGGRCLRGRAPLPRHAGGPDLGRQYVRGADGAALRARGDVGAPVVGPQPPAVRARADRARYAGGGLRVLGLLAVERPGGRVPRVRRRPARAGRAGLYDRPGAHRRRPAVRGLPRGFRPRPRSTATAS